VKLDLDDVRDWRLEQLTTYLEARANVKFEAQPGRPHDYRETLNALNKLVCHVLWLTNGTKPCRLHTALFELVRPKAVLTFNYDLIADQTLLEMGKRPWTRTTYCTAKTVRLIRNGHTSSRALLRQRHKGSIDFYKLHGSMHWNRLQKNGGYQLAGLEALPREQFQYAGVPDHVFIVPPIAAKMDIPLTSLKHLWSDAASRLRKCDTWIVWGYSFPATDTITTVLLKTAVARNRKSKKRILVINPDPSVQERVSRSLHKKVLVRQWFSVERFLLDHEAMIFPAKN
jgi:hypothetical protein